MTRKGIDSGFIDCRSCSAGVGGIVAVLFYEVMETDELSARSARSLGWTGQRIEVHPLKRKRALRFADNLPANDGARSWLRRHGPGRILVFSGVGSLCLSYARGRGYSIEPGTLDKDVVV